MEKLNFKVSSALKDIIGRDLITNELVAIFELVKNGYDADASKVDIIINSFEDYIIIQDNGIGMNREDIINKWLFVAHSEKKDGNRVYAGSKGIGRFSCDRLGTSLQLTSKKNNELSRLDIDWGEFEKDSLKKFEDLEVTYHSGKHIQFNHNLNSGTILKITNLRDTWDSYKVGKVISALQRLVNPFVDDNKIQINVKYFSSSSQIAEINTMVSNNVATVLDRKTIVIECTIQDDTVNVSLKDKEKLIYSINFENTTLLKNIYFKLYYLNLSAKNNFKRIMGTTAKEYGSLFLYKNNFRIFPYGEPDYDAFGLNLRKTQGYNRYIGHRELLGWININDTENNFKEVTSRDRGFVTNAYTVEFEETYMEIVHRPLESYVQLVNFGNSDIDEIEVNDNDSIDKLLRRFKRFNVIDIEKYELPKISQPLEKKIALLTDNEGLSNEEKRNIQQSIKRTAVQLSQENKQILSEKNKIEKKVEQYKVANEIQKKIIESRDSVQQEMLAHQLGKISKDLNASLKQMLRNMTPIEKEKFQLQILDIRRTSDKLSSIKSQILRLNFTTFSKWQTIELKTYFKSYFDNIASTNNIRYNNDFSGKEINQKVDVYDLGVLLDNLIINAREAKSGREDVNISVYFELDNSCFHFISDTAPISVSPIEEIFEPGITSKRRGTGLGMYICKKICEDFGWQISVSEIDGKFVDFKMKLGENIE